MRPQNIMLMVEIDSNAILIEPMKSRANTDIIAVYDKLVNLLKWAGITHKQHVLDNEMSEHMKNHIRDHYRFKMELVPPGCHSQNAPEVSIPNFT